MYLYTQFTQLYQQSVTAGTNKQMKSIYNFIITTLQF